MSKLQTLGNTSIRNGKVIILNNEHLSLSCLKLRMHYGETTLTSICVMLLSSTANVEHNSLSMQPLQFSH